MDIVVWIVSELYLSGLLLPATGKTAAVAPTMTRNGPGRGLGGEQPGRQITPKNSPKNKKASLCISSNYSSNCEGNPYVHYKASYSNPRHNIVSTHHVLQAGSAVGEQGRQGIDMWILVHGDGNSSKCSSDTGLVVACYIMYVDITAMSSSQP